MKLLSLMMLIALHGAALAQPTGGSMGGGSWGGASSGGGGTGVGTSFDATPDPQAHPATLKGVLILVGAGVCMLGITWLTLPRSRLRVAGERRDVGVGVLRIAIDTSRRAEIQRQLAAIASTANTSNREGLTVMLHELVVALRRVHTAWAYGSITTELAMTRQEARATVGTAVIAARSLFAIERIRNAGGAITRSPSADVGSRDGFVLVTLVIAKRGELFAADGVDRGTLDRRLAILANAIPVELVAVEAIWSPADEGEPLSSLALEARLPGELIRLNDVIAGTLCCEHCHGRYPAEQLRCPHCGSHMAAV